MKKLFLLSVLMVPIFLTSLLTVAEAAPKKVMWGKTELKIGQIGKVTILSTTPTYQMNNDKFKQNSRTVKKGDEYRVYSYKGKDGGYYGLGGGLFVKKSNAIKYETPSKSKLSLLKKQELSQTDGNIYPDGWVAPVLKSSWSHDPVVNYQTLENELGFTNGGSRYALPEFPQGVIHIVEQGGKDVNIVFFGWEDTSVLPNSYRVPIIAKELFKLYFANDATDVWNYFNSNDIPEEFTANGRNVTVTYSPVNGAISLSVR